MKNVDAVAALLVAFVGAACAAQPAPAPTATKAPIPCATPPPGLSGCGPPTASPTQTTAAPTAPSTATQSATATATATATPAGGVTFKQFENGFGLLTFVTSARDGSNRLFAVEQIGRIDVVEPGFGGLEPVFLDISARVSSGGERGLLGLAFHPDYKANGRLFVNYTNLDGNTVVAEYLRNTDNTADPASERILFTVKQPFPNHNGGMLAFGPDGMLYVGLGDGGSGGDPQGNGQNPTTLLGKIVRIDVDAAAGSGAQPQLWDMGLRNPWRFSFDRQTGDLWIGDVGQGLHEEIDAEPAGQGGRNYGWNVMEGASCYNATTCDMTGLTMPVATYDHVGGNCSVTGGYVYRGSANPGLVGTYLYGDLCSGNVWGLDAAAALGGENVRPELLGKTGQQIASFGEDEAGEVYIVDHSGRIVTISGSVSASPQQ